MGIHFMATIVFYTRMVLVSVTISVTVLCDISDNKIMIVLRDCWEYLGIIKRNQSSSSSFDDSDKKSKLFITLNR